MLLLFSLSACSERNLEIGFLSKAIQDKTEFNVDNVIDDGDMLPDATESSIPMEISCSSTVNMVEVQNPQSKEWKQVTDLVAGLTFDCAASGKVSFALPTSHVAPYVAPTISGDHRQDFQIRWKVKNLEGETSVYYRTLSALFKAPTVSTRALDINIAASSAGYTISGNCSLSGGSVILEGPFANGNIMTICADGSYTTTVDIDSAYPRGPVAIRAKHQKATDARAYGEFEKVVQIDVQAPTLSFTTPTQGKVFTAVDVVSNSILVEGTCSESMKDVEFYLNDSLATSVTCSAALGFSVNIVAPEGDFQIKARQNDDAGNFGESVVLSLHKDTTPPGAFTIMGVRSSEMGDVTTDGLLTSSGLRVDLGASPDAVSYEAYVMNNTGTTTVCPLQTNSSSYVVFSSCNLQNLTIYKVYAYAKDSNGNTVSATNNGEYTFTTQFPIPKIVRIYSDVTGGLTYKAGNLIPIFVEFDRPIAVSGSPLLNLSFGGSIGSPTLVSVGGVVATLRYSYTVADGHYTAPLGVDSVNLNGGRIYDSANTSVNADTSLVTDSGTNSNFLKSRNIKIDGQNPNSVTDLTLGSIPSKILESPSVSFTTPTDPDTVTVLVRIVRVSDGLVMSGWSQAGSGATFNMSSNVDLGTAYRVEVKVRDPALNESTISSAQFTSFSCPADFAYIFNPAATGVNAFCVGKFEAKGSNASPQFIATGAPITNINQMQAISSCNGKGSGYALITNQEWNAIADLIRQQPSNWTGGAVESGMLHRGNSVVLSPPVAANTSDPCSPADASLCASSGARRTSNLPYSQQVWDFAGNAWEVTSDADSTNYFPASGFVADSNTSIELRQRYGTLLSCTTPGMEYCGFGKLDFSAAGPVIWRGGAAYGGNPSGVFAAKRSLDAAGALSDGTYRCVFRP